VRQIRRAILTAAGLVTFGIAVCALVSRYLPITNHAVLVTSALSPYLLLFAPVSMALLILASRWILAILGTGMTVTMLVVQLPLYVGSDTAATEGVRLRVISANLRDGQAEPQHVVSLARDQTDVLTVQELTSGEVDRLSGAGIDVTFPYRWLDARGGAQGVGLWSRFPLDATRQIGGYTFAMVSAQIRVPGIAIDPTIVVVHLPGPWPQPIDSWRRDISLLPATLQEVADRAGTGCVIAASDLNSTTDMRPFRTLLNDNYRDAAEQSGSGIQPTFPGDSRLPPLIVIDHILTRNCTATSLRTVRIPGSDHRGLVATVMIPRSAASPQAASRIRRWCSAAVFPPSSTTAPPQTDRSSRDEITDPFDWP
jgi:endonuclease/exonuclease/phosphatase (EEP) superfamily protein YafD